MSAIVPRWEWRGFGDELRDVESCFGGVSSKRVEESDEIYVLSVRGTDAVKFRNELMDVKHLLEVNDDGLEQWVPVMKTGFPVSATDVGSVLRALRVDAQSSRLARAAYTLPEFLDDVVGPHPDLLAVEVHKRRERYTVGGCMAEVSEFRTGRVGRSGPPGGVGDPSARREPCRHRFPGPRARRPRRSPPPARMTPGRISTRRRAAHRRSPAIPSGGRVRTSCHLHRRGRSLGDPMPPAERMSCRPDPRMRRVGHVERFTRRG